MLPWRADQLRNRHIVQPGSVVKRDTRGRCTKVDAGDQRAAAVEDIYRVAGSAQADA